MKITDSMREIAVNVFTDITKNILGYLWKSMIAGGILALFYHLKGFLFAPQKIRPIFILVGVACLLTLIFLVIKLAKKKGANIPISNKFYHGHGPNQYTEKTKWNYKQCKKYYYIPLLSHGHMTVEFVDFCGPFCAKCHHLLSQKSGMFCHKFECLNCERCFTVPKELATDNYKKRLFRYFETEYKQGHLKEASL